MKTPDEIKKGLIEPELFCDHCQYNGEPNGCNHPDGLCEAWEIADDSYCYTQQLEAENADLKSRLAQAERERDAAVNDLKLVRCCGTCVNNEGGCTTECYIVSGMLTGWKWRGVCPENSKEDSNGKDQHAL